VFPQVLDLQMALNYMNEVWDIFCTGKDDAHISHIKANGFSFHH
jgi:hypothetical protein